SALSRARRFTTPSTVSLFSLTPSATHPDLHSFPTRRSSDLFTTSISARRSTKGRCGAATVTSSSTVLPLRSTNVPMVLLPASERSEEHTSELQSRENLVCRLLLEKKKSKTQKRAFTATRSRT